MEEEKKPTVPQEISVLTQDLVWANFDLIEYKKLFYGNQKQLDMLKKAAGNFFYRLYQMYWDRFSLSIYRLTERSTGGKNENLTLKTLKKYCDPSGVDENKVNTLLVEIDRLAKNFNVRRRKYVAHRDLNSALGLAAAEREGLLLESVERIYSLSGELLNLFHVHFDKLTWGWAMEDSSAAWSLLVRIRDGLVYEDLKERRMDWRLDQEELLASSVSNVVLTSR
jgi:hypothetical protein